MLETNMREKQENRIVIYVKDGKEVETIRAATLEYYFMWTNILREGSNGFNLIRMLDYYEMDMLFQKCLHRLIDDISVKNYFKTTNVFNELMNMKLRNDIMHWLSNTIKKQNDFLLLFHSVLFVVFVVTKSSVEFVDSYCSCLAETNCCIICQTKILFVLFKLVFEHSKQ